MTDLIKVTWVECWEQTDKTRSRCQVRHELSQCFLGGASDLVGQEGRITVARVPENRLASDYAQAQASIYSNMAISGSTETNGDQRRLQFTAGAEMLGEKQVS